MGVLLSRGVVQLALIVGVMLGAGLLDREARAGELMKASSPHRRDGFLRHGSGALDDPFIVLVQQQRADEAGEPGRARIRG
jgi:hypothetical protein